jgi:hypothetical protein
MSEQLVTVPLLKRAFAHFSPGAGGFMLRELQPETDYALSFGLLQLPLPNVGKHIEISAYQEISLAGGAPQSYQLSAYLQTNYSVSDFAHLNPAAITVSGSYIDSTATIVESGSVTGNIEDGMQIAASLLVRTHNGQRARLEISCNIDLENGCTLDLIATPLDGDYHEYFYGFSLGVADYTEPRDIYALTLDFLQPVGPLDWFEAVVTVNVPAFNVYSVTQIIAKRYLPMAATLEGTGSSGSLPVIWEDDRLRLILDDSANYSSGNSINSEMLDQILQHLQIEKMLKCEVTAQ